MRIRRDAPKSVRALLAKLPLALLIAFPLAASTPAQDTEYEDWYEETYGYEAPSDTDFGDWNYDYYDDYGYYDGYYGYDDEYYYEDAGYYDDGYGWGWDTDTAWEDEFEETYGYEYWTDDDGWYDDAWWY